MIPHNNHQLLVFRQIDKMIRQKEFYKELAARWQRELDPLDTEDPRGYELRGKIDVILHCARDLQFMLDQSRKLLSPHEWDDIERKAIVTMNIITQRKALIGGSSPMRTPDDALVEKEP